MKRFHCESRAWSMTFTLAKTGEMARGTFCFQSRNNDWLSASIWQPYSTTSQINCQRQLNKSCQLNHRQLTPLIRATTDLSRIPSHHCTTGLKHHHQHNRLNKSTFAPSKPFHLLRFELEMSSNLGCNPHIMYLNQHICWHTPGGGEEAAG